jgi:hypothetical protein
MAVEAELARVCCVQRSSEDCDAGGAKCGLHHARVQHLTCVLTMTREATPLRFLPPLTASAVERFVPMIAALRALAAEARAAAVGSRREVAQHGAHAELHLDLDL